MDPPPGKARTLDSLASSSDSRLEAQLPEAHAYAQALYGAGYGYPVYESDEVEQDLDINVGSVVRVDENGKASVVFELDVQLEDDRYHTAAPIPGVSSLPFGVVPRASWTRIQSPVVVDGRHVTIDDMGGVRRLESLYSGDIKPVVHFRKSPGACVALGSPAFTLMYDSSAKPEIVQYILVNLPCWRKHANEELALILDEEELLFVHGTVKTTSKFCLTLPEQCLGREGELDVHLGSNGLVDEVHLSFGTRDVISSTLPSAPSRLQAGGEDDDNADGSEAIGSPTDKCVFFNYFKAKRRRTRAHPGSNRDHTQNFHRKHHGYDPVDVLLDYILENPNATVAVASDTDVYALLHGTAVEVLKLAEALPKLLPHVHDDKCGVGTVIVDWSSIIPDVEQNNVKPTLWSQQDESPSPKPVLPE